MFTRRAALRVAYRAKRRLGVPLHVAVFLAFACRKHRLRYAIGFAVCQQESGFRHVFGHDAGGLFAGRAVTRRLYRRLRSRLKATGGLGANGVGLFQITYWTYVVERPGLWRKRANVYFGISIVAGYVKRLGLQTGLGAYNGGEGNPQIGYAREVEAKANAIRAQLAK